MSRNNVHETEESLQTSVKLKHSVILEVNSKKKKGGK